MPEFIGFADFAKLAEIEPPLPTIEGLPGLVNPLLFLEKALFYKGFGVLVFLQLLYANSPKFT